MVQPLTPLLDVRFYATANGSEPVRRWLRELSHEDRKVIGDDIKTVQFGWPIGMPLVRNMESGLWEVRARLSDGIARILFTTVGPAMVLLHGFVKKSQKTPRQDITLARKRMREVQHG